MNNFKSKLLKNKTYKIKLFGEELHIRFSLRNMQRIINFFDKQDLKDGTINFLQYQKETHEHKSYMVNINNIFSPEVSPTLKMQSAIIFLLISINNTEENSTFFKVNDLKELDEETLTEMIANSTQEEIEYTFNNFLEALMKGLGIDKELEELEKENKKKEE